MLSALKLAILLIFYGNSVVVSASEEIPEQEGLRIFDFTESVNISFLVAFYTITNKSIVFFRGTSYTYFPPRRIPGVVKYDETTTMVFLTMAQNLYDIAMMNGMKLIGILYSDYRLLFKLILKHKFSCHKVKYLKINFK